MISNSLLNDINEALNKGHLTFRDFDIAISTEEPPVININYRYIPRYFMTIDFDDNINIDLEYCPGDMLDIHEARVSTKGGLLQNISDWVQQILMEMRLMPNLRYITELREELNSEISKFENILNEVPESYFTKQEADEYNDKLDALQNMFNEKFKSQEESNKELARQLSQITDEIEVLKSEIKVLTKKNWFLSLLSKTFIWSKNHPNEVKSFASAAVGFLPEGVKEHIPQDLFDVNQPQ
ncbi:hypothetical protein [Paenibacillus sp. AR247]|uniref:hypothetical protein n=1 Tax=Paenibacillus sp. AR247 TaxID=1631599 RepID=UPI000CF90962|nr:hypothetical protein [Paenibacillus sp. AR247]PQP86185.1 hypothetical protein CPT76_31305 [Paenibacillus sp. AR247]